MVQHNQYITEVYKDMDDRVCCGWPAWSPDPNLLQYLCDQFKWRLQAPTFSSDINV